MRDMQHGAVKDAQGAPLRHWRTAIRCDAAHASAVIAATRLLHIRRLPQRRAAAAKCLRYALPRHAVNMSSSFLYCLLRRYITTVRRKYRRGEQFIMKPLMALEQIPAGCFDIRHESNSLEHVCSAASFTIVRIRHTPAGSA